MKELINKLEVKEAEARLIIEWLVEAENPRLEGYNLTCLVKYLLKQVEVQSLRIDLLVKEVYELKKK